MFDLAVEDGYTGTLTEWLEENVGVPGDKGEKGTDGESAYDIAVRVQGFEGTETEWLESLKNQWLKLDW